MKLAAWRKKQKLSYGGAAKALGLKTAGMVHRYEQGRVPAPEQMKLIKAATKGEVTADDFFDTDASAPSGHSPAPPQETTP
jgi:transcriptional regulator with XRE-family HTH domain